VEPSVVCELHGSSNKLSGGGEGTEAARVELSMMTRRQWRMAAGVAAPCVHNREKRKVIRLRNGHQLLREEVEVEPLTGRRWIERRGGGDTVHGRQGKVKMR
jgi:hypothetical protein